MKDSEFKNVFIHLDLTPVQQEEQRRNRLLLKERRDKGEDVVLYGGQVILRCEVQHFCV